MSQHITKPWRSKSYKFRFTLSSNLVLTARRFKTSKSKRSKTYTQLVIPIYISGLKEIAIRLQKRPHLKRRRRPQASSLQRRTMIIIPIILILSGISGTVYFGLQAHKVNKLEPVRTFASAHKRAVIKPKVMPRSEPTHIVIASVGIDTGVISVGRDSTGGIEMPPLFDWTTGWYNLSPTPGELGPAIIVGHVDTYKGISVFWRLREVKPGDVVDITRADGSHAKFKIEALKQFDQSNFPTQEVYGNIDHAGLRLITCGGAFDNSSGSYTQNTVVYASLI